MNHHDSKNLSAIDEVQSSLDRKTKYVQSFIWVIDSQFDKDIYCVTCREGCRGKNNGVLEHGFIKYLIYQTESLRGEIKAKNKIIDNFFTLKLSLCDEQNFTYKNVQINKISDKVNNETVFHKYSPYGPLDHVL